MCWKEFLIAPIRLTILQNKYPTCRFYAGASVNNSSSLGKYCVIFQNTSIANSVIGDHTFIQKNSRILNANVGKFCSIASRVSVGLGKHSISSVSSHPAFYLSTSTSPIAKSFSSSDKFSTYEPIHIGHDVWIGENVLILDGVRIGTGAVIGAGAVVTGDIPEYAIAVGVPARIIKYRFSKDIRQQLIETKWWDMPNEWLQAHCDLFSDPINFLQLLEN